MRSIFFILFFFHAYLTMAQSSPFAMKEMNAKWKVGDSMRYSVQIIQYKELNGEISTADTSQYTATIRVLDQTDSTYTLSWATSGGSVNNPMYYEMIPDIEKYLNSEILYTTDRKGAFKEMLNWKEIGDKYLGLYEELIVRIADRIGKPESEIEALVQKEIEPFKTREGVEKVVLKELTFYHLPYGHEYLLNEEMSFVETIPAEPSFDFDVELYMELADGQLELSRFSTLKASDQEKFLRAAMASGEEIDPVDLEEMLGNSWINLTKDNTYHYEPYEMILEKMDIITSTKMGVMHAESVMVEEVHMKLIED